MMVSPTKLTVHFAKAALLSLFASPRHLKTGRSESNLRLCGKFWQQSSKFSSLKEMTQELSLFLRSTSVHKYSASRIAGSAWENQCSNLLQVETDRSLLSLLLICVFLSRSFHKPARPMFDGRPFASPLFRRLAGGGPFFRGCPFRWALQFALSLVRCLTLRYATPYSREDPLYECGRPRDTLSCLFFTALRLHQSQSILTQVQQSNDIELTCYKTLPTKSVTCLQVGPVSLVRPVALSAESDQSSLSPSDEGPNDEHPDCALQLPHIHVGCGLLSNNLQYNEVAWIGTHVSIFPMTVFDALLGILEVLLGL